MTIIKSGSETIRLARAIGDTAYLKCRDERVRGIITAVFVRPTGACYGITWGNTAQESTHYDFELIDEFEPDFNA